MAAGHRATAKACLSGGVIQPSITVTGWLRRQKRPTACSDSKLRYVSDSNGRVEILPHSTIFGCGRLESSRNAELPTPEKCALCGNVVEGGGALTLAKGTSRLKTKAKAPRQKGFLSNPSTSRSAVPHKAESVAYRAAEASKILACSTNSFAIIALRCSVGVSSAPCSNCIPARIPLP